MKLIVPPAAAIPFGLRAMKMVATAGRELGEGAGRVLSAAQRAFLGCEVALDVLAPIAPDELAAALRPPELRLQLVQGMLMLALADGPPSPAQMSAIEEFARALDVRPPELRTLRLLADEQMLLFRLDFLRRSHLREVAEQSIADRGLVGGVKALLGLHGLAEDKALAARYRKLERFAPGTFGRALADYFNENGFAFPGERFGFPERALWHDAGHVLTGYATDPAGELSMAAFQAGYRKHNPFLMMLFGAVTFSAGVNVTPLPQPDTRGLLARPGLADAVLRALQRGSRLRRDLADGWELWPELQKPLDEVRDELGCAPADA